MADAGNLEEARRLFSDGIRRFEQGDWGGAVLRFREANAEHHAPAIVYNIGLAEEKLGHPQAAVDAYEAYLAEAGETGDMAAPASAAVAQLKARSTRLRIESTPPGARAFVDGHALSDPTPAVMLVPPGHHVIVVQAAGWRQEQEVNTVGKGEVQTVRLSAPSADASSDRARRDSNSQTTPREASEPEDVPNGFVWGAGFSMAPVYLVGATNPGIANGKDALSVVAGPTVEFGYAMNESVEVFFRGVAGIGPDRKPYSYAYMGGPTLSYRVTSPLWVGVSFLGGEILTAIPGGIEYGSDLVFGAGVDAMLAIVSKPYGQWMLGLQPSVLLTNQRQDNTAIFLPIVFGFRAY
jgi:hypothetical protein